MGLSSEQLNSSGISERDLGGISYSGSFTQHESLPWDIAAHSVDGVTLNYRYPDEEIPNLPRELQGRLIITINAESDEALKKVMDCYKAHKKSLLF